MGRFGECSTGSLLRSYIAASPWLAVATALPCCGGSHAGPVSGGEAGAQGDDGAISDVAASPGTDGAGTFVPDGTTQDGPFAEGSNVVADSGDGAAASGCVAAVASSCNSLSLEGPTIDSTCSSSPMPQPTGGSVTDGLYVLESMTYFDACPAAPDQSRAVWAVCGSTWQTAQEVPVTVAGADAGLELERVTADVTLRGTEAHATATCTWPLSSAQPQTWSYDGTAGTLTLYISQNGGTRADFYARQ
ncbi:MAG: hypothetical protein ACLP1X_31105 [Polyangiaceae bacterium]|jgi:hypothetical protein